MFWLCESPFLGVLLDLLLVHWRWAHGNRLALVNDFIGG